MSTLTQETLGSKPGLDDLSQLYSFLIWKKGFVQGKITQISGCCIYMRFSFLTISFYSRSDPVVYCAVLCCAVLCCAVLCCAVLCCAVLCCAVLCCAVLCCAVLCCAVRAITVKTQIVQK